MIIYRLFRVNPYVLIAGGCVVVLSRARVESDYRVEDVLALRLELDGICGIRLIVFVCWCVGRFRRPVVVRGLFFFLTFTELVGLRDGRVSGCSAVWRSSEAEGMIAIVSNSDGIHLESVGCGIIFIVVWYASVYSVVISMSMTSS